MDHRVLTYFQEMCMRYSEICTHRFFLFVFFFFFFVFVLFCCCCCFLFFYFSKALRIHTQGESYIDTDKPELVSMKLR